MDAIGVDLSKNHYGLCHIDKDGKINFFYSWFKPFLKRDYISHPNTRYYKEIEKDVTVGNIRFQKIRYSYDDRSYNQIECDALKSRLNVEALTTYMKSVENSKMVVLEDYVTDGTKIVQLVHVGETFKYSFSELKMGGDVILFLCPNVTWRSFMCKNIELKTKDPYEKIKKGLQLYYPEVFDFIENSGEKWDVQKELIDSIGLANTTKYYGDVFQEKYNNRLFIF